VRFARSYGVADLEHRAPVTADTVFQIASVTKQFTAAAVLLMVEDGRMSLDDKLSRFVPEFPGAERVTLRQLLIQTSGIADYAEDPSSSPFKSVARTPEEMAAAIARLKPAFVFEPGASWAYSNSNYQLLGLAVSRAAGKPLAQIFAERLFGPAGMVRTAMDDPIEVVPNRARGYRKAKAAPTGFRNADWISPTVPGPAGGLRSTAADLIAWNRALYGGRILKPQSLAVLTAPGRLSDARTTKAAMPPAMQAGWNSDYAMGLLVGSPKGRARFWHSGDIDGFASWLAYYPEGDVSIVILHNSQSAERFEQEIEDAVFARELR
jgi:CubicO group peptidase (beta-lactamase class C family)